MYAKISPKMVNPRDIAGDTEEGEDKLDCPSLLLIPFKASPLFDVVFPSFPLSAWSHTQKSHPKLVNPRDIAGNAEEEEEEMHNVERFSAMLTSSASEGLGFPFLDSSGLS